MEINYKQIGALILAIIITASGTIYLEKTGDYDNCRGVWTENSDGSFTCPKTNVTNYCYEIENRGSGWYRCWIGVPIPIETNNQKLNKGRWTCNPTECIQK